jgi:hypothetical protein
VRFFPKRRKASVCNEAVRVAFPRHLHQLAKDFQLNSGAISGDRCSINVEVCQGLHARQGNK